MTDRNVQASGGDYTTWAAWEAATPANLVTSTQTWRGLGADETFSEADLDIGTGVTTDATFYMEMATQAGTAFDGIAGQGPAIDEATGTATDSGWVLQISADYTRVTNIEVTNSQAKGATGDYAGILVAAGADFVLLQRNIIHDIDSAVSTRRSKGVLAPEDTGRTVYILNNIIYNMGGTDQGRGIEVGLFDATNTAHIIGNSLYNTSPHASNGKGINVSFDNGAANVLHIYNNLVIGQNNDYDNQSTTGTTFNNSHNGSGDTTALGTSTQQSLTASTEWVDLTGGSEDLHLDSGSTVLDDGSDRGTTPTNVEFDIDDYDRDAGAVTWDIGADQQGLPAAAATSITSQVMHHRKQLVGV